MSKASDLFKVGRIIESCRTVEHLIIAVDIVDRYFEKYSHTLDLKTQQRVLGDVKALNKMIDEKIKAIKGSATFTMKRGESLR